MNGHRHLAAVVPMPTAAGPWLTRELASRDQAEILFRPATAEDPHPSEILATRSSWRQRLGELYDEMTVKDADLAGIVDKRAEAVRALPRRIEPADSTPPAIEAAELCRAHLGEVSGFDVALDHLLGWRARGTAFAEVIWEELPRGPLAGTWAPVDVVDRPMRRFVSIGHRLHVRRPDGKHLLAPAAKFIHLQNGTKEGVWGTKSLFDGVYWYYWMKKEGGWKFWALFLEKFAMPTVTSRYPSRPSGGNLDGTAERSTEDLQRRALEIAAAVQSEYAVALPEGVVLEFLEATRGGNASYPEFVHECTRAMALRFLGEINTSGLRPGTGAFASERISYKIQHTKVQLDAHDLGAAIRDQLLRPIVRFNLGPDVPVPRYVIDSLEAEDRDLRQAGVAKVLQAGQPVPRRLFYQVHQVEVPGPGDEIVVAAPQPASVPDPEDPPAGPPQPARLAARSRILDDIERAAEASVATEEELAAALRGTVIDHFTRQRDLLLDAWDQGQLATGEAWARLGREIDRGVLVETIAASHAHGLGLGLAQLIDEGLPPSAWRVLHQPAPGERFDLPLAGPRPGWGRGVVHLKAPPGAGEASTWQLAIDLWAEVLAILKGAFLDFEDSVRRRAFTIARVNDEVIIGDARALVAEALQDGWSRQVFRDRLAEIYEGRGLAPTSPWHADLILNNSTRTARDAVRWQQTVGNPAAHRLIPYLVYVTLDDPVVRPRHRLMHRKAYAITHEIWHRWRCPAGHNCRCWIGTVNRLLAARLGYVGAEPTGPWPVDTETGSPVLPDPGFRGSGVDPYGTLGVAA